MIYFLKWQFWWVCFAATGLCCLPLSHLVEPKPSSILLAWPQRLWQAALSPSLNILPFFRQVMLLLWIWAKINKVFPPSSQPYFIVRYRHCSLNWQGCVRVYRCAPPAAALPHHLCHSWLPQPLRRTSPHPPSLQQGHIRWMSPGSLPQSRTVTLRFGLKLVLGKRVRKKPLQL